MKKEDFKLCCMNCKRMAFYLDLKTNEYLCGICGKVNMKIYQDYGKKMQMEIIPEMIDHIEEDFKKYS